MYDRSTGESREIVASPKVEQKDMWNSIWIETRWWMVVVSNIFYFDPYLGKISILTNIFQMGWFNHQPGNLARLR